MKKRILLGISTLALAFCGMGCLLQPMTPEEEAELRAEMEQYENADEATVDEATEFAESDSLQLEIQNDLASEDPSDWSQDEKPDPTPWVASYSDRKPDPTPWHTMSGPAKPDPTPWNPMKMQVENDGTTGATMSGKDKKPDPTPWLKVNVL